MKIRLSLSTPLHFDIPNVPCWNVRSIDDFMAQFVCGDKLRINDLDMEMRNFTKHSDIVATFDTRDRLGDFETFDVMADISCALSEFGLNNVDVTVIRDDQDPFADLPQAKPSQFRKW